MTLTRKVGAGGEADVFEVAERPGVVCKHYRAPTPERAAKLRVMVASPPSGTTAGGHVSIAWPTELVVDGGNVSGFLMPRIDVRNAIPVFQVYNPASRLQVAPGFTWRYLLRTARNIAAIVDSLHGAGYVVGDLNESNLLVDRRALVSLVDCDSMQVTDPATGEVHRSPVGKPEFLAPELHGHTLADIDRSEATDAFALAVLTCQLLLEGVHPFAGVWKGGGEPPDLGKRIRKGWMAHRRFSPVDPPPFAVGLNVLPVAVRRLARRGLSARGSRRPQAWEWVAALEAADARLRTCRRSPHHLYAAPRRRCPWCARIDAGLPDPFPGPSGASALTRRTRRFPSIRARIGALSDGKRRWVAPTARLTGLAAIGAAAWTWPLAVVPAVVLAVVPAVRLRSGWVCPGIARANPPRTSWRAWLGVPKRFVAAGKESVIVLANSAQAAATLVAAATSMAGLEPAGLTLAKAVAALTAALHPVAAERQERRQAVARRG